MVRQANSRKNGAHWPWLSLEIIDETGARVGTVERILVKHFDPDGRLRLRGKKTKMYPDGWRTIPIDDPLTTRLKEWLIRRGRPGPEESLLGIRGKLVRSRGRDKLIAACNELGIEPFTWHGVRRRVVRRLRRDGVSVTSAAAYLGHSPMTMLRLYDEIDDDDLGDEMQKVWAKRR